MNVVEFELQYYSTLTDTGEIDIYIGENDDPSISLSLEELTEDFLADMVDRNGYIYKDLVSEIDSLLETFKRCVAILEKAKAEP